MCGLMLCLSIGRIINYIVEVDSPIMEGVLSVVQFGCILMFQPLFRNAFFLISYRTIIRMRSLITFQMHKKIGNLSLISLSNANVGKMIGIIS